MTKQQETESHCTKLAAIVLLAGLCWFVPPPTGLGVAAWHSAVIFISTIAAIVAKILPLGAIGFISLTVFAITNAPGAPSSTAAVQIALGEMSNPLIWLVIAAFLIARGFIKTGLGRRIALLLVSVLGKHVLGMGYGLALADLILAPAMPSMTARCGGVIYPIANSLARNFDSRAEDDSRGKIGTFLVACIGNVNDITSTLFITSYVGNILVVKLAKNAGVEIEWMTWFIAMLAPCLASLIVVPPLIYWLTDPEIKSTPDAPQIARAELAKMGRLSCDEWLMLATFALLLGMWVFSKQIDISDTLASFIGLSLLLLCGVLSWEDVKNEKGAWDTLIWFSALLMMANVLKELGFTAWVGQQIGDSIGSWLAGTHWFYILLALNLTYFYIHYIFASGTAHVAALYAVFLTIGVQLSVPAMPMALMLAASSSLFCSLTQYAAVRGAILFGSGFVPVGPWWRTGFVVSLVNLFIFFTVGLLWWKALGLY